MNAEKPPPQCKAILLCKRADVESGTEDVSLMSLVHSESVSTLPSQIGPITVYLQLVDGIGRYRITVEIRQLADDRTIARGRGPRIDFPDRLTTLQLTFSLPALPIVESGRYDVIVFADDQEIDRQQFTVLLPNLPGEEVT